MPSAPFLYELASHVKQLPFRALILLCDRKMLVKLKESTTSQRCEHYNVPARKLIVNVYLSPPGGTTIHQQRNYTARICAPTLEYEIVMISYIKWLCLRHETKFWNKSKRYFVFKKAQTTDGNYLGLFTPSKTLRAMS